MATENATVSLAFKRLDQANLLTFSGSVAEKTNSDDRFLSIKPLIDDKLIPANDAYENALEQAQGGGNAKTQAKNNVKKVLINILGKVAQQVNLIADGNAELILAAGFEVRNVGRKHTGDLDMVTDFVVEPTTTPGTVKCSWEKVAYATNYALEYAAAGTDNWHNGNYSTGKKLTLKGLPEGEVAVRICALGNGNKKSAWKVAGVKVY